VGAAEYAIRQAGWPEGRATLSSYEGGHMAYTVERSAKKFTDDIRTLITSTTTKPSPKNWRKLA
jgi:hypothetical protein